MSLLDMLTVSGFLAVGAAGIAWLVGRALKYFGPRKQPPPPSSKRRI